MIFSTLARCLALGLFWASSLCAQDPGFVKKDSVLSTKEHGTIRFVVALPPSYENQTRSYPVIYYLHGLNQDYLSPRVQWIASFFGNQFSEGQLEEFILVFVDGKDGFWCDHADGDPLLETELVKYLVPFVDENYRSDPSRRLIMGYSAGGNGAVFFYAKHPDLFIAALSLDGALMTWEEFRSFQGEKPDIIGTADYYYEYASPNKWVERNREILTEKPDTSLFISAAYLKSVNRGFLSILHDQGIPASYIEVDCTHEFGCIFSESQEELLRFLAKKLGQIR